jgi:prevent-host-death family protein
MQRLMYILYMPMSQLTVAGFRTRLAEVLRSVERGQQVVVTRSGRPIVKLLPVDDVERQLHAAGLHAPRDPRPVPRVRPVRLGRGRSLTRTVLEGRD